MAWGFTSERFALVPIILPSKVMEKGFCWWVAVKRRTPSSSSSIIVKLRPLRNDPQQKLFPPRMGTSQLQYTPIHSAIEFVELAGYREDCTVVLVTDNYGSPVTMNMREKAD